MRIVNGSLLAALIVGIGFFLIQPGQLIAAPKMTNTIGSPGVALRGYDVVAYFTQGKPSKGKKEYSVTHAGVEWHFASEKHQGLFKANPAKYVPAYVGFCAYGVSQNYRVKTEPDAWSIVKGRLYLNYDKGVRTLWNKKQSRYISQANANWKKMFPAVK